MASTTRFVPNPNFSRQLVYSTLLLEDLRTIAEDIVAAAQAVAPVDTGDYRASIQADVGIGPDGAYGIVNATDPVSPYIEFGTVDTPTFAPLRRGTQAAGYRLGAA